MKNHTTLNLIYFLLVALMLLFPFTTLGEEFREQFFSRGNLLEEGLIPTPTPAPEEPPFPPPTPVPL